MIGILKFMIPVVAISILFMSFDSLAKNKADLYTGPGVLNTPSKTAVAEEDNTDIRLLACESNSSDIVVIMGYKDSQSKITLSNYIKDEYGNWSKDWSVNGVCGENGISDDKIEGDRKTPSGIFNSVMAFGIMDNPGTIISYHKISNDDYWIDDQNSKYYNKLKQKSETNDVDWNSAEHMIDEAPYYNYGIALDYNIAAIPGKGSGIFIHCNNSVTDVYSAGCIRIPQEYMIKLLQDVNTSTKYIIVADKSKLVDYY